MKTCITLPFFTLNNGLCVCSICLNVRTVMNTDKVTNNYRYRELLLKHAEPVDVKCLTEIW